MCIRDSVEPAQSTLLGCAPGQLERQKNDGQRVAYDERRGKLDVDVYKRQGVYLAADTRRQAQFSEAAAEIQGSA